MKVAPTESFTEKALSLPHEALQEVVLAMGELEKSSLETMLQQPNILQFSTEDNPLYVISRNGVRLIFSVEEEDGEDLAVVADVILYSGNYPDRGWPKPTKDIASRLRRLNPRSNNSLNPKVNSRINPRVNSKLNPRVNSRINPRVNSQLNLRINSRLNPRINSSINPRFNASINPKRNPSYGGPYLYNSEGRQTHFVVRATDSVLLVFNDAADLYGLAVETPGGGYALFRDGNEWVENWVADNEGGYLRFTTHNDWLGLVA